MANNNDHAAALIEHLLDEDEAEDFETRDAKRIAAREPVPAEKPFAQAEHDELLKYIDAVAEQWVEQLKAVRRNSEAVEQMVLERTAKIKISLSALFVLGHAVTQEARRGDDVNNKLSQELDKLSEAS